MDGFISEEFARIINRIPDNDYNADNIISVFKEYIPGIASRYGMVFFKAIIKDIPKMRNSHEDTKEIILYDIRTSNDTNDYIVKFDMGNGGVVEVITGINIDKKWTLRMKRDAYIIARTIYLLYGRANAMKDLNALKFTDQMTGIANALMINRYMRGKLIEGDFDAYCVNFINIKNMKLVNNRYSNKFGDSVIAKYANIINDYVGDNGCVARMGGDNFFVCIDARWQESFLEFVKIVEVRLDAPGGQTVDFNLESRVGYYYVQPGDQIDDAMRNCDIAMRYAKHGNNPDIVLFEPHMLTQMFKMKQLEENIPAALENEEFVVYYQPKADITNASEYKLCGAEALVRWMKDGKLIPPNDFIPIIEKNGMVVAVDFYVFEHVCRDIKRWESLGLTPVRISSNFSRRNLRDFAFADKVEAIINKYDVNPKYLEIEITESYDEEDMEALTKFEKRMHELGVDLSVDDFGSGFSSLKMVKDIVSDTIKLDKSIIDGVGCGDNGNDIIVSNIIHMIKCLGKDIIAEGVEQEKQAEFLRNNGCNKIQGYLYGRPEPMEAFEKRL